MIYDWVTTQNIFKLIKLLKLITFLRFPFIWTLFNNGIYTAGEGDIPCGFTISHKMTSLLMLSSIPGWIDQCKTSCQSVPESSDQHKRWQCLHEPQMGMCQNRWYIRWWKEDQLLKWTLINNFQDYGQCANNINLCTDLQSHY